MEDGKKDTTYLLKSTKTISNKINIIEGKVKK